MTLGEDWTLNLGNLPTGDPAEEPVPRGGMSQICQRTSNRPERRNAGTPERRNAGTPERRNAGTPERRNAGILKPGTQNY